ncbi:LysR family transcriptional regulator [Streptomyces sioyaensis]|uniref:LysR family transcriptional regulator n=1 Tax=Streptomyces sioyaensis TaxID=67364 RepID=UPI0037B7A9F8
MLDRPAFSLTQLFYFVTIAGTGSISEAAARLHTSQSAVSSAIQRLERQLGSQLLVRQHAKGVTLTPSGRLLLEDAQKILLHVHNLKDYSTRLQEDATGRLDVGSCCSITPFLIPKTLARLGKSHPELNVAIHDTHAPLDLLRNGVCELVVTYSFTSSEGTQFTELATPPLYALVAPEHPLAKAGKASLSQFSNETLVVLGLPSASASRSYIQSLFAESQTSHSEIISVSGIEAMRGLVAAGQGFMLTHHRPHSMETLDGGRVALVEITDDHPRLSIGVITVSDCVPSRRARVFVAALRMTARQVYAPVSAGPQSRDSASSICR